jgi:hypothetical protein
LPALINEAVHQHRPHQFPAIAHGRKGHRHLQLKPRTPIGNLWLTVADTFGERMETYGDSDGRVEALFA